MTFAYELSFKKKLPFPFRLSANVDIVLLSPYIWYSRTYIEIVNESSNVSCTLSKLYHMMKRRILQPSAIIKFFLTLNWECVPSCAKALLQKRPPLLSLLSPAWVSKTCQIRSRVSSPRPITSTSLIFHLITTNNPQDTSTSSYCQGRHSSIPRINSFVYLFIICLLWPASSNLFTFSSSSLKPPHWHHIFTITNLYPLQSNMSSRKKVLLKVIILGDSG